MACTAASRLLGFVRTVVIAAVFGAGGQADVFHAVFQVPNSLRRLLAEGAFSAALVPALAREQSPQSQSDIVRAALALQIAVTVPLILVAVLAAAPITRVLFAFPDPEKMQSAVALFRAVVPYAAIAGGAAVLMGGLHARGQFVVPALAPLLFSLGVITAAMVLSPSLGIYAAAVGVVSGGVLQLLFQIPSFLRLGFSVLPRLRFDGKLRRILRGWGPAVLSALVFSVVQQVNMLLASGLEDGGTSAIGYAVVFFQLPLGVLSVSVVTAAFPKLSALAAANQDAELRRSAADGVITLAALLVPAAVVYLLLGDQIVRAALQRGEFDAQATELTAAVLRGYAIGLPSVGIFTFLQRLCYAIDNPGRALRASIVVGVIDVILSLWWRQTALGVVGLALANSAAFTVGALLLAISSRLISPLELRTGALRIMAAAAPVAAVLWVSSRLLPAVENETSGVVHTVLVAAIVAAVTVLSIVMYWLVGLPFVRRITERRGGSTPDYPERTKDE